jgi:enamine deaminase RidA (YjgF/YER057c/UK114 family)
MIGRPINAADAPAAVGGYAQAMAVDGAKRLLFVSGQIPMAARLSI